MFEELYADPERLEQFMRAMSGISLGNFAALAEKFDFSQYQTVCDVGGATGQLSLILAERHPHLRCVSFDLPVVEPIAQRTIDAAGLAGPVSTAPSGDFFADPLPSADVITMGMILHDWNLDRKQQLIQAAYDALPDGGALIAVENIIDDDRRENVFGLMMSLNMLIEFGDAFDFTGADYRDVVRGGRLQEGGGRPPRRPGERRDRLQVTSPRGEVALSTDVELRVLGPVELIGRDGPLHLGGPHQRAIVALLALHAGRTVATDDLIDGLWGDAAPQHVRKSLSTQIARVRRPLAEVGAELDAHRRRLPARPARRAASTSSASSRPSARRPSWPPPQLWPRAIDRLRDGLALWRGAPLADLGAFPFAQAAAGWLVPRRQAAEDRLADLLLAAGEPHEAAQLLERLVEDNPYDERRWAQLVRALSAGGRRRDALLAYQRARDQLGEGLGLDPGPELREVERDVLAGEARSPSPAPRAAPVGAPFIGRTVELDRLDRALERAGPRRAPGGGRARRAGHRQVTRCSTS